MKTTLALLLVGLLAFAAAAQAQAPDAQQVANETVQKGKSVVGEALDGAGVAVPDAGGKVGKDGPGLGGAASAVGRFLQAVADSTVAVAGAAGKALGSAGTWMASGLATGLTALVKAGLAGLATFGGILSVSLAAFGSALGHTAAWLGAQLGVILGAYSKFVSSLRPRGMNPGLFTALAATGTTGSAVAAGYGLWALAKKYAWLLSGLAGFSRIEDSALLEHPLRAQVFQVIQSNPGIHASELSRKVGAGWGTIVHHLDKLEKGRLVTARRVNNQKCFFEDGGKVSRQDMAIAGAVRGDSASLITAYVTAHPMTTQKAMAAELDISPALTSFHVKKLAAIGVLDKVRRGKETLLTTTLAVRRVLPSASPAIPAMAAAQA